MKVILLKDVEKIGKAADIVSVKDGFGRNFLIARGLARPADKSSVNYIKSQKEILAKKQERQKLQNQDLAKRLSEMSCTIASAAGEDDKLYGTVTNYQISETLKHEGVEIDKKDISIDEPISKLGVYQVRIRLDKDIEATLRIWVVKK